MDPHQTIQDYNNKNPKNKDERNTTYNAFRLFALIALASSFMVFIGQHELKQTKEKVKELEEQNKYMDSLLKVRNNANTLYYKGK